MDAFGTILLTFLFYLYLPHVVFKLAAERHIDLGRKIDSSEIEEILAGVVPSALLHFQSTFLTVAGARFVDLIAKWGGCPVPITFPGPNLRTVSFLFSDGGVEKLAKLLSVSYAWMWPTAYACVLFTLAFINGMMYGKGVWVGILVKADPDIYPEALDFVVLSRRWDRFKQGVALRAFRFWRLVYREYHIWLFKFTVLTPWVYVRTMDGTIYHGQFYDYEKAGNGGIDLIELRGVSRIDADRRKLLSEGVNPLKLMPGTLHLKWSQVSDLNPATKESVVDLYASYELDAERAHQKANPTSASSRVRAGSLPLTQGRRKRKSPRSPRKPRT